MSDVNFRLCSVKFVFELCYQTGSSSELPMESNFIFCEWRLPSEQIMQWKFNVIVVILVIASEPGCQASKAATSRFTIEELLTTTFPYSDPRTDSQLDMDPCKAGKNFEVLHSSNACSRKSFQKVFKNCLHKNNLRCQAKLFLSSCFASLKTLQLRLKLSHSNRARLHVLTKV